MKDEKSLWNLESGIETLRRFIQTFDRISDLWLFGVVGNILLKGEKCLGPRMCING